MRKRITVLVVDDLLIVRKSLNRMFKSMGMNVIEAESGTEAIRTFTKTKPDLVTLDIRMPDMSGMEVLKKIRKIDPNVVVMMVSAENDRFKVYETLDNGADDFVSKPFDASRIMNAARLLLGTV